jgi:hypothetical protein
MALPKLLWGRIRPFFATASIRDGLTQKSSGSGWLDRPDVLELRRPGVGAFSQFGRDGRWPICSRTLLRKVISIAKTMGQRKRRAICRPSLMARPLQKVLGSGTLERVFGSVHV